MFVTYLPHSYLLDPHNINMLVCLRDWYRWQWSNFQHTLHTSLNWIPWRNVLNLNTFDFVPTLVETRNVPSSFSDN